MAFWCQLVPCHAIVVKWGCNNCNNMFLTQFEPLLRCSFYLRGAGGGICDSACLNLPLQLGLFILPTMPVANQVPLRALLQLASPRCALQLLWKHKDRPPKQSLSTRRAAGLQICLLQLSLPFGVCGWKKALEHRDSVYERRGVAQPQVFPSNFSCLSGL